MDCSHNTWPGDLEYLQQFNRKVVQQRIPLSGSIDLTHRCNLRCVHCYLGDQARIASRRDQELSTGQWLSILDEITEAGCLYLLITGGEPLLRNDFCRIYRHARESGLLVTVFTNGTRISEEVLQLFQDLPPQAVEISLYGATRQTYEEITGVRGSYDRCIDGIEQLLAHNIRVKLKTILMTLNSHEFDGIAEIARDYGVPFRFDAMIFPRFNGDPAPMQLRVDAAEAVEKEFAEPGRKAQWQQYNAKMSSLPGSDDVYTCGAGLSSFHVNGNGYLQPCLMATRVRYDLTEGSFPSGWKHVIPQIREKKIQSGSQCRYCDKMPLCGYCPPIFELENGSEEIVSPYACQLGHHRLQQINHTDT